MTLQTRTGAFEQLGKEIKMLLGGDWLTIARSARNENPWFTTNNVELAFRGIVHLLEPGQLNNWNARYAPEPTAVRTIGVAMAGNIPMVGFHDALCILIAGHRLRAKLSSQDTVLMKHVLDRLCAIEPSFAGRIQLEDKLTQCDAIIATGGNNTGRYFEYYFRNLPHIIRKNRSSCAVLSGDESEDDFRMLGQDVFSYFGLGCRNISKLYVPPAFDFQRMLKIWTSFKDVTDHSKYGNNYDYQRAIFLINAIPFYDNGCILLKEDSSLVSPISIIYYEHYRDSADRIRQIRQQEEKLQCVVSAGGWFSNSIPFGSAQFPGVGDYADGIDTRQFLQDLN